MEGLLNREWGPVLSVCGEIVGFPRGATPTARASPPDWPRAGGGGALGQWDWVSENAVMKVICLLYYTSEYILRSMVFVNQIYDTVVAQFHKFYGRPFARALYLLKKNIGRRLSCVLPGSTGRFYKDHAVYNHSAYVCYITRIEGGVSYA